MALICLILSESFFLSRPGIVDRMYTELPEVALMLLASWSAVKFVHSETKPRALWLGVTLGLLALCKASFLYIGACFIVLLFAGSSALRPLPGRPPWRDFVPPMHDLFGDASNHRALDHPQRHRVQEPANRRRNRDNGPRHQDAPRRAATRSAHSICSVRAVLRIGCSDLLRDIRGRSEARRTARGSDAAKERTGHAKFAERIDAEGYQGDRRSG